MDCVSPSVIMVFTVCSQHWHELCFKLHQLTWYHRLFAEVHRPKCCLTKDSFGVGGKAFSHSLAPGLRCPCHLGIDGVSLGQPGMLVLWVRFHLPGLIGQLLRIKIHTRIPTTLSLMAPLL